jgi:outer membrane protein W
MSTARLVLTASVVAAVAMPGAAAAQLTGNVIFTPYVGAFVPTSDLAVTTRVNQGITAKLRGKQQPGMAFGANGSYWMSERLGIELGALYTSSKFEGNPTQTETVGLAKTVGSDIWLSSAKLMLQMLPASSSYNLRFGLGPAVIHRGGAAFDPNADGQFSGVTDVGAAMSLCTRLPLSTNVALRFRAENYLYQAKLRYEGRMHSDDMSFDSRLQNDLVFSLGLQFWSRN